MNKRINEILNKHKHSNLSHKATREELKLENIKLNHLKALKSHKTGFAWLVEKIKHFVLSYKLRYLLKIFK